MQKLIHIYTKPARVLTVFSGFRNSVFCTKWEACAIYSGF